MGGNIINGISIFLIAKKLIPFYKVRLNIDKSTFKMLFGYGVYEIFIKLANLSISHLGRLIIGIVSGTAALTYYLIPQNLTTRINGFNYKISEILFPISSQLSSSNQNERLNRIYLKMSNYTLALKLSIYTPLFLFSYKILRFWMGKEFAEAGWLLMILLSLGYFVNSLAHLPGLITYGLAKLKITSVFTTLNFIILIATIYPLIKFLGITGAGLSYLLSTLVFIYYLFYINKNLLHISVKTFVLKAAIKPAVVTIIISIICLTIKPFITNLLILLVCMIFAFVLFHLICFIIGVYDKQDVNKVLVFAKLRQKGS